MHEGRKERVEEQRSPPADQLHLPLISVEPANPDEKQKTGGSLLFVWVGW